MICACRKVLISKNEQKSVEKFIKLASRFFSNESTSTDNVSGDSQNISSSGRQYSEGGRKSSGAGTTGGSTGKIRGMKAWQIHSYGGLEELQLENCRVPVIKLPTDVLIKVRAASVNPIDIAMTKGYGSNTINVLRNIDCGLGSVPNLLSIPSLNKKDVIEFPLTMGRDYSGVIVETGHGVTGLSVGDEVYGVIGIQRQGSHAEYTLASQDTVKRKPSNLSFVEAASLPYVGLTSWAAIKITGNFLSLSAKKFLVLGGSGGVGTFAIQYLKSQGSHVVATCSEDAIPLLEKLGSDFVIDYRQTDYSFQIQSFAPYDCILDLSGPGNSSKASNITKFLKPVIGQYITLSPPFLSNLDEYGFIGGAVKNINDIIVGNMKSFSNDRVPTKWAFFIPSGYALQTFTELIERGRVKPVIDGIFSFQNVLDAYKRVEDGHLRGKVVIEID